MARADADRCIEIRHGGVIAIDLAIGEGAVRIGCDIVRIDFDRGRKIRNRFLEATDARIGSATRVVGLGRVGVCRDNLVQRGNIGLRRFAALFEFSNAR
jgi:hypothetical protein